MVFSKIIKLVTHFVRFPLDILLWPVSVLFGWYHGIIKMHALATLNEVSNKAVHRGRPLLTNLQTTWGSRAGADASDSTRMVKQKTLYEQHCYRDEKAFMEKLPLTHDFTNNQALAA